MAKRIKPTEPPPLPLTQWTFTSIHEGVVPHLYLDAKGWVTCGVGFLVPHEAALARYPWRPSEQAARGDWAELHRTGVLIAQLPAYYRRTCNLSARLSDADMHAIFDQRVAEFRRSIEKHWQLSRQPECVQLALVDMAWQLGELGLRRYIKMHAAVMARYWLTAARESFRADASFTRNAATARMFVHAGIESAGEP